MGDRMIVPPDVKARAAGVIDAGLVVLGKGKRRPLGRTLSLVALAAIVGGCGYAESTPTPNPGEGYKTSITITETVDVWPVFGGAQHSIICYTNSPIDVEITPAANYKTRINGTVHCPIVDDHSQDVRNAMGLTGNSPDAPKLDITTPDKPIITPFDATLTTQN